MPHGVRGLRYALTRGMICAMISLMIYKILNIIALICIILNMAAHAEPTNIEPRIGWGLNNQLDANGKPQWGNDWIDCGNDSDWVNNLQDFEKKIAEENKYMRALEPIVVIDINSCNEDIANYIGITFDYSKHRHAIPTEILSREEKSRIIMGTIPTKGNK